MGAWVTSYALVRRLRVARFFDLCRSYSFAFASISALGTEASARVSFSNAVNGVAAFFISSYPVVGTVWIS